MLELNLERFEKNETMKLIGYFIPDYPHDDFGKTFAEHINEIFDAVPPYDNDFMALYIYEIGFIEGIRAERARRKGVGRAAGIDESYYSC